MALAIVLGAFIHFVRTETGKEWVRGRLSALLSSQPDRSVELGRFTELLPWDIRLENLVVSDAAGAWLHMKGLVLRWNPAALLRGKISVQELRADSIQIDRLPASSLETPSREPGIPRIQFSVPPVTIGGIAVPRLSLGQEVLGHAASLEMAGFILPVEPAGGRSAFLQVNRLDPGQTFLVQLDARLDGPTESLQLRLEALESADGLLAHVLGLRDAGELELRLSGFGPASGWHGDMDLRASRRGSVSAALSVTLAAEMGFELAGAAVDFRPSSSGGEPAQHVLFNLKGRHVDATSLFLDHFTAHGEGVSLEADAKIDLATEAIDSRLTLTLSDAAARAWADTADLKGEADLCAMVSGTLRAPRVHLNAHLRDLKAGGFGADHVAAHLQLETASSVAEPNVDGWRVASEGKASGLSDSSGNPLPETSLDWLLEAEIPTDGHTVLVKALRLAGAHHRLDASGRLETASMTGNLEASLRVRDLRTLTRLLGRELPGTLHLDFRMSGEGSTRSAAGTVMGRLTVQPCPDGEPLVSVLGPATTLKGHFEVLTGPSVYMSDAVIESPALRLRGNGSLNIPANSVDAEIQASVPDLKALAPLLHEELSGEAESSLKVAGPLDDLTVSHEFKAHGVRWRQQPPTEVRSSFQAANVPGKARGQWKLLMTQAAEKLEVSLGFERQEERLLLTAMRLDGPGGGLQGDLALDLRAWTAEGVVKGRFEDLGRLGRFIGEPMTGGVSLEARLSAPQGGRYAVFKLNARSVSSSAGKAGAIDVTGEAREVGGTVRGSLQGDVVDLESGGTQVRSAALKVEGDPSRFSFSGKVRGRLIQDAEFRLSGIFTRTGDAVNVEVSDFRGSFGTHPIQLRDRLLIRRSPAETALDGLDLSLDGGRISADGLLNGRQVRGRIAVENIPLGLVGLLGGPELAGKVRGKLDLEGNPAQPFGSMELQLSEFRVAALEAENFPPARITAGSRLEGGTLRGDIVVEELLEKPARADYVVPLRFSLSPAFRFELPPQAPLQARAELEGELGRLAGLIPLADQTFSGRTRAALHVTGSLAQPDFRGAMTLSKGSYENLRTGTVLKEVDVEVSAQGRRIEITRFQATDGARGGVSVIGWLELDAAERFPMEIEAVLKDAVLVHRSDMDATADGIVKMRRTAGAMRVEGDLTVLPAEYRIPDRLPPGVVDLQVTEIDKTGRKIGPEVPQRQSPEIVPLDLGLTLNFPNRTFVRGRGLDSEWRGLVTVSGTAARPSLTGRLSVVRGRFDFLDRRFDLNQGTITFMGTSPPDPYLDLRAEARARDITALVRVIGPASSPEIRLDSDPPLPQEEILARLLFGRSVDKISPIQALKLAQALRSLSGDSRLPGMDFLGTTRRLLGLDQLEFRTTDGGSETGLGFGKYLTEDIYVDVEKDLRGTGGRISVEVELTPNISLESQVGADAETGIGINWKYDY